MTDEFHATLTSWRRHLHAHPGLTLHEGPTAAFVVQKLREMGVTEIAENVGGHGVVATIRRGGGNRSVGLRGDMDALPIQEQADDLPWKSTVPGVMHACGHDGHTTALLGAARLLLEDKSWTGAVQLVFQPAEEGGGGALAMIADGLFTRFPMDRIFGWHNWPGLAAGTIAVHDRAVMAAGARIELIFDGHAGHAALPHLTRDPLLAAGHAIVAAQSIVARNVDPLMGGVVSLVAATCGVKGTLIISPGLGVTANSPAERDLAAAAAASVTATRRDMLPAMTGEDFAWFLKEVPGAFVWIGNGPAEEGRDLHNARYDFNDAILPVASKYLSEVAKRALSSDP